MNSSERRIRFFFGIVILKAFYSATLVSSDCDSPWIQLDDACYYVTPNGNNEQVASWHQSQSWCLQNGGDLATIEDIDERRFITNLTQVGSYNGAMWIGLNRLEDRINYTWTDGSTSEFRDWSVGEPDDYSNGMCAFQLTHPAQNCFTHDPGFNSINGLFDDPYSDNPPHTFYLGYLGGHDDNTGSAECQSRCLAEPPCYSYTFISNSCPNFTWMGECMGRSNEYDISDPYEYAISGEKYSCSESGYWFVGNCGEKRGFICKKTDDNDTSTVIPTKLPTPTVPGFCPAGYIDGGGNKCFKIVVKAYEEAVTWDTALILCRAEPGIAPDLASILSEYENAAITMYLRYEYWGFWVGLRQSDSFSNQWLWTDNQDATYFNWASTKPSGSAKCTELWTDPGPEGTWNNLDCMDKRGYICQTYKDANSIIVTPPTTPTHSCPTDYYNYGGICYRKITSGSSWSSALATCEADGATLATIHSEAENAALYVFGSDIAPFWIGYHKNENDEWVWTDGWPDLYSNWNAGEDPGTGGGCTSFKDNGNWKDDLCNNTLAAICMISTATVPTTPAFVEGVCPSSEWVDYGSNCYYFSQIFDYETWDSAQALCNSKAGLATAGSLVSIHSAVENQFIYEHLKSTGSSDVWIGLNKVTDGSPHTWSDGSELQYVRWAPGEPNDMDGTQRCVEMYVTMWPGMWNDHLCPQTRPYVCKAPKVPLVSSVCDSPWIQLDDACYYISPNGQNEQVSSWHESQNWCLQNGGDLATIEDIDERRLITNLTQGGIYNGAMWIGLNKLEDRINYKWSDGSTSEFRDWAVGEPDEDSNGMCVFQLTHSKQECFTRNPGVNTVYGLFGDNPHNENRSHTFYFGYLSATLDDNAATDECQSRCSAEPLCYSFTFISKTCPDWVWMGECTGRSNEYDVNQPDQYAFSGDRYNCGESGYWYVGNCGEKRGFICKKAANTTSTPSPTKLPTPTVPGFCPAGYIDGGGNKCFKIVAKGFDNAVTWDEAVDLCRAEPGIAPDLASIMSEYETAAITMYIRNEYWGFWIGLRQSDLYSDQWLWTDNQDVAYLNWASAKPSGTAKCTELWTDPGPAGTWNNLDCFQGRGYICQIYKDANSIIVTPPTTPAHSCKTDYYNYGGICYRKITSGSSWSSALATCEADGATLATIHNEAENAALYVFGRDIAPFWIGYHMNENDEWVWTDSWPDLYSNWNVGEDPGTGGGCASFKDNGKWKDDECNNNLAAICMISTATVPTTPAFVEGFCPSGWADFGSNCYYFSDTFDTKNWQMAMASCDSKAGLYTAGNLASIHSPAENQFIYEKLKAKGVGYVWIGLYKEAHGSPHKWSDGTELQYVRWAPGEPNDLNGTQQCVEMYVTMWPGMWNDHLCNQYMPYVCKTPKLDQPPSTPTYPPAGSCSSEFYSQAFGDYCYYMDTNAQLTFKEAQEKCVHKANRHAELLTILDPHTNLFIMEMVGKVSTYRVQIWLGLMRPNKDAEFRWVDGTQLNFTNWAPGEPNNMGNEHCAEIHSDIGVWNDMNCETNHLAFICQIKRENLPPPTVAPEPEAPSSEIFLTSGELAGIIIGTMLGMIVIIGVGLVLFGVIRGGLPFSTSKKSDGTETASTYDLPYNNYDEQPYGTLSRSSSVKSSTNGGNQSHA